MIPRFHQVELLKDDMWLVYFFDPEEKRFPIMRIVPTTENPISCPGGELWCKQFGCVPGDNVFTRAEPELLVEEGTEIPAEWEFPTCDACGENPFECDCKEWTRREACEWCGFNRDCVQCDPESYDYDEGPECTAGCDYGQHKGCEQS